MTSAIDLQAAKALGKEQTVEADQYLEYVKQIHIEEESELRFVVSAVAEIKEKSEAVDAQRKRLTVKAQAIIDEANAFFRPAIKSLTECEGVLKGKMADFNQRQAVKRDEILAAVGKGEAKLEDADACLVPKVPGLSLRESIKVEVADAHAAVLWCMHNDRVELLQLNEKAIKAIAKAGSPLDIPGVTVSKSSSVAITVSKVERG